MRTSIKRLHRDDRGISAVVVSISLIALFGVTMLSVDAGNMWQTRRNLITGTDATALDRARAEILAPGTGCAFGWEDYLQRNAGSFVVGSETCSVEDGNITGTGYVVVKAAKEAKTRFGGLLGIGDTRPESLSAAQIFYPQSVEGLRPIGLCSGDHHLKDEWIPHQKWLRNQEAQAAGEPLPYPASQTINPSSGLVMTTENYNALANNPTSEHPNSSYPEATSVVHHVLFDRISTDQGCGSITGNWGWQDFDGQGNPNNCTNPSGLCYQLMFGYQGAVGINDCNADGTTGDYCPMDPGAQGIQSGSCSGALESSNTLSQAMRCLVGRTFPIVVYDTTTGTPTGSGQCPGQTCQNNVFGFLTVTLWNFYDGNAEGQERYLDLEFKNFAVDGICCSTTPNVLGTKSVRLCEVDHDIQAGMTIASRCGG